MKTQEMSRSPSLPLLYELKCLWQAALGRHKALACNIALPKPRGSERDGYRREARAYARDRVEAVSNDPRTAIVHSLLKWIDVSRDEAERLITLIDAQRREAPQEPLVLHKLAQGTGWMITDLHIALNILAKRGWITCESVVTHITCQAILIGPRDCCEVALMELFENGPVRCPGCKTMVVHDRQVAVQSVFHHAVN